MALEEFLTVPKASQIVSPVDNPIYKYLRGSSKTILPSWKFSVTFENEKTIFNGVEEFHILDVNVPLYKFSGNTVQYGSVPKTYGTLNSDTGLQFGIMFEEDSTGTITKLIHTLQRRVIRQSGVYNVLPYQNLGACWVTVYNGESQEVMRWTMNNIWYAGADDLSLAYSSTDSIKWKINFGCDIVSYEHMLGNNVQGV